MSMALLGAALWGANHKNEGISNPKFWARMSNGIYNKHFARRNAFQYGRITNGINDGSLSGRERAILLKQQTRIAGVYQRALSDGDLSYNEKLNLERRLNGANRTIYQFKHNGEFA